MNILILEDNPIRIKYFVDKCQQDKSNMVHITRIVSDASVLIDKYKYDLIFLDHDLDGDKFIHPMSFNTGSLFSSILSQNSVNRNTMTIIHSHNQRGADMMKKFLPQAIYIPFMNLDIERVMNYQKENLIRRGVVG